MKRLLRDVHRTDTVKGEAGVWVGGISDVFYFEKF